jgi:rubredoxin
MSKYICPVCGFLPSFPPSDYHICPSCGVEFDADTVDHTIPELRSLWIARGMTWTSRVMSPPSDYNPVMQLQNLAAKSITASTVQTVSQSKQANEQ